ncbi:DUF5348 domain-containing protein [Paenibacillus cremeus]|uniref:DUF5348 domain-containing protein n=1 Tax=Paenibacillus cremeus TaxID=2163881 RepID=A0A559K889_9BACL|nr:DUF5348 domain-containing protein [Paenibacillus cremeus]TVY08342.1 hypothetical protein FPZ49_19020 [Paenibacillus cremeus]
MKRQWRTMMYSRASGRWEVHINGWLYELNCGEWLEIRIGDKGIPCRIELDRDWYVIMREARFNLRKKDTYQVEI